MSYAMPASDDAHHSYDRHRGIGLPNAPDRKVRPAGILYKAGTNATIERIAVNQLE